MIFDAYAFIEKLNHEPDQAATPATLGTKTPVKVAVCSNVADVAGNPDLKSENPPSAGNTIKPDVYPYGRSTGGRALTSTGKVISLDAWRRATGWERHGANGKQWNGLTHQWEAKP